MCQNLVTVVFIFVSCCLFVITNCATCIVELRCSGYDPDGSYGYLQIDSEQVSRWTSSNYNARRRKRQATLEGDAWHLFAISDQSCEVSDETHFANVVTDGNAYIDNIYEFFADQPSGAWLIGCSSGGVDPYNADTALRIETQNLFRAQGINTNLTSSATTAQFSDPLTPESALLFFARKGFPQDTEWAIVDSTGAAQAALTSDGTGAAILSDELAVDYECGAPFMPGPEVFRYDDGSTVRTGQRETVVVTNSPVTCIESNVMGWEYIPNADNSAGPALYFGFVRSNGAGGYDLVGSQEIVTSGNSDYRQYVCADAPYPVELGDYYGLWYDDTSDGPNIIRRQYEIYRGRYSWGCGRQAAAADLDTLAHGTGNTFPFTPDGTAYGMLAFRPIFDVEFKLMCGCASDEDCTATDANMECRDAVCQCVANYAYNRISNRCINNETLVNLDRTVVNASSTAAGDVANIVDSNTDGSLVTGTCFSTEVGSNPWVVIDLGIVATIHSVEFTTPNAPIGYLQFESSSGDKFVTGSTSNLTLPFDNSELINVNNIGPYYWRLYNDVSETGDYSLIDTEGDNAIGSISIGTNILSIKLLDDVGYLTAVVSSEDKCVDYTVSTLSLGIGCSSLFFFDDQYVTHVESGERLEVASLSANAALSLGNTGTLFETTPGDGFIDLNDIIDSTTETVLYAAGDSSLCIGASGDNLVLIDAVGDCLQFTQNLMVQDRRLLWEVQKYQLDGDGYCDNDISIFYQAYDEQPCVRILDYTPTAAGEDTPFFIDVTADGAYFMNNNESSGYTYSTCNDLPGEVLYSAQEFGLEYFYVGVANEFDGSEVTTTTFPNLCASYRGNVAPGEPFLLNCTNVLSGRYIGIFMENTNDLEQMHLCNVNVYGRTADACQENNGCCNHNCVPGLIEGEKTCTCYSDEYYLSDDQCTCLLPRCATANDCDNDILARCVNSDEAENGYVCQCQQSTAVTESVVFFDYDLLACSVPQELRNTEVDDHICSYDNGGCEDTCVLGELVIDRTCTCSDGLTLNQTDLVSCDNIDECVNATDNHCSDDVSGLGVCVDADPRDPEGVMYTCECAYSSLGIYWDSAALQCTTGQEPDHYCSIQNGQCEDECVPDALSDPSISPLFNYVCNCTQDGYQLASDNLTCEDVDECVTLEPCDALATCVNLIGSYTCLCPTGYEPNAVTGACEVMNLCLVNNGRCGDRCEPLVNDVQCFCDDPGYNLASDGELCEDINECLIDNAGCDQNCFNNDGSFTCGCNSGYTFDGNFTCTDIDECAANNAGCEQTCINIDGSFYCECTGGYTVSSLDCQNIDECSEGTDNCTQLCTDLDPWFECSCSTGYELDTSDDVTCLDIDECQDDPCSVTCTNTDGSYECSCQDGFTLLPDGTNCESDNECDLPVNNCEQDCINVLDSINANGFECSCNPGYELLSDGISCQDVDECSLDATNVLADQCDQTCTNTVGSYTCDCDSGYRLNTTDNTICDDIDECQETLDICEYACTNDIGSYFCSCPVDYVVVENVCILQRVRVVASFDANITVLPAEDTEEYDAVLASVEEQLLNISRLTFDEPVARIIINSVSEGSIIVDYTVEFANTVSKQLASVTPLQLRQALEQTPIVFDTVTAPLVTSEDAFRQVFTEVDGVETVIIVETDVCELYAAINYCQQNSTCVEDDAGMPYCDCQNGYIGDQCNIVVVSPDEEEQDGSRERSDGLTGIDVILIAIFSTLVFVMVAVLLFYCIYRLYGRSYYTRPMRYRAPTPDSFISRRPLPRGRYPTSTIGYGFRPPSYYAPPPPQAPTQPRPTAPPAYSGPWWSNMAPPPPPAAEYSGYTARETYLPRIPRAQVDPDPNETREERLSKWPAYRAYGMARRFTGAYGDAFGSRAASEASGFSEESRPYSWRTAYFQ